MESERIILWTAFNIFVLGMLALDLGVFHRKAHAVRGFVTAHVGQVVIVLERVEDGVELTDRLVAVCDPNAVIGVFDHTHKKAHVFVIHKTGQTLWPVTSFGVTLVVVIVSFEIFVIESRG